MSTSVSETAKYSTMADAQYAKRVGQLKDGLGGMWVAPVVVFVVALVVAAVLAVVLYFLYEPLFSSGAFSDAGWISYGAGALIFIIVAVFIAASAATLALAFSANSTAFMALGAGSAVLMLLAFLAFQGAKDEKRIMLLFGAALFILGGLAAAIYGLWSLYSAKKTVTAGSEEEKQVKVRYNYAIMGLVASVISGGLLGFAFYKMHGLLPA